MNPENILELGNSKVFNEQRVLSELKHFLPAQAPLKDFIHHNTLHAFQHLKFFKALRQASDIFGYKVSLSLDEYRQLYQQKKIREEVLERIIEQRVGLKILVDWKNRCLSKKYNLSDDP